MNFRNLFLIGYRGTGKTSVARALSTLFNWPAVDADVVLEEHFVTTIQQIFAEHGEADFRDKETQILQNLCTSEQQIIGTGGGVVLRNENRQLLRASGKCIWLTASPKTIHQRLLHDVTTQTKRPDLNVGGLEEIEALLAERETLYRECADWIIDADSDSPEQIAQTVLELVT